MSKIIHPNFRVGPSKGVEKRRKRAVTLVLSQGAYDALMAAVGGEDALLPHFLLEAVERDQELEPGTLTDGLPKS